MQTFWIQNEISVIADQSHAIYRRILVCDLHPQQNKRGTRPTETGQNKINEISQYVF